MTDRSPRNAFTLIDLLVVIAIIAILAAILFPVFAQAREKARQTSCMSNLKQIGLGVLQYHQDFDEVYPMGFYKTPAGTASASQTPLSWPMIVQPYIKSFPIFQCPSETATLGPIPGSFTATTPNGVVTDYLYNFYLGGDDSGTAISSLPQLKKASQTVMMVDGGANAQSNTGQKAADPTTWVPRLGTGAGPNTAAKNHAAWLLTHAGSTTMTLSVTGDYGAPLPRHQQMTNVLWADGHARASRVENIYHLFGQTEDPNRPTGAAASWSPCLDPAFGCP